MKSPKKILIIVQRSNGDVFLSNSLVQELYEYYHDPKIDLLVNDDTFDIASLIPYINKIYTFSYQKKKNSRWKQEKNLVLDLYKKYDLSINLTASDRSVIYAFLAGKISISAIEKNNYKSWWKKKLLDYYYYSDLTRHILLNNLEPLRILNIQHDNLQKPINISNNDLSKIKEKLESKGIKRFIIFHPSAQYNYKIYPKGLRIKLLTLLNTLEIPIIITGGNTELDLNIKNEVPALHNIYNFIGETTLYQYFVLSKLSIAYIGMDTLNMHIAASQSKQIFAIFGPTNISMWSPWSNQLKTAASKNKPIQTYGKNTIFQSSSPCEVCGFIGCGSNHGKVDFSYSIDPKEIFNEVSKWYQSSGF